MNPETLGAFGTLDPDVAEAVALAESETSKPRVGGMGIYLEFPTADEKQTTQILITPQGKDEKGQPVDMAIITRTVAEWSPRKQWRSNRVRMNKDIFSPDDQALQMAEQVERTLKRQMMYGATTLRGSRPIVFELTDVDFTEIRDWKAPASALRRIQKTRLGLGFPEKLYK